MTNQMKTLTKNIQYSYLLDTQPEKMGMMASNTWNQDPKRVAFVLSRYKFVAKMFENFDEVLEVGCGDAWASRIVKQSVKKLTVSDFDPTFIENAKVTSNPKWEPEYLIHDFVETPTAEKFSGVYLLDVFEHIEPAKEINFLTNIKLSLKKNGVVIIGCPSLQSQSLIDKHKRDPGHINCKTSEDLKETISKVFENVFMFGMNDECLHISNPSMNFYNIALGVAG